QAAVGLDIGAVQAALRADGIDAWLLYDFRGLNPLAADVKGVNRQGGHLATRRWYYLIPADGEPRGLVHAIEKNSLAHLPGTTTRRPRMPSSSAWPAEFATRGSSATPIRSSRPPNNRATLTISRRHANTARFTPARSCCWTSGASSIGQARCLRTSPGSDSPAAASPIAVHRRSEPSRTPATPPCASCRMRYAPAASSVAGRSIARRPRS